MDNNFIIKSAAAKDIHKIYSLRSQTLNDNKYNSASYQKFWEWVFMNNPRRIFHVLIGLNKSSIIAQAGLIPVDFYFNGKNITGGFFCELMVRNDFRNTLLFFNIEKRLIDTYKSKNIDFIYGLINKKKVLKAHLALGYRRVGLIPVFVRPINLKNIFNKLINDKILIFILKPVFLIIEYLMNNYNYKKTELNIIFEKVNEFSKEMNSINLRMEKQFDIFPLKNKKILNWRFVDSPNRQYNIYLVKKKSKILGYYVSRKTKMKNFNVLAIVDLFIFDNEDGTVQAILNHINDKSSIANVDFIGCMMNPKNPVLKLFKKNLFIRTNQTFTLITHGLKGSSEKLFQNWFITWFDHDVV